MITMTDTPRHCANNTICAVDVRFDGINLLEVCFMPVGSMYTKSKHANMFTCRIKPIWPVHMKRSQLRNDQLQCFENSQVDIINSVDMFMYWLAKVRIKGKLLMPMAWNWSITGPIIQHWLGENLFNEVFHPTTRDLSTVWNWILDRSDSWGESRTQTDDAELGRFFEAWGVSPEDYSNPLERTKCLIDAYNKTLRSFMPGYK